MLRHRRPSSSPPPVDASPSSSFPGLSIHPGVIPSPSSSLCLPQFPQIIAEPPFPSPPEASSLLSSPPPPRRRPCYATATQVFLSSSGTHFFSLIHPCFASIRHRHRHHCRRPRSSASFPCASLSLSLLHMGPSCQLYLSFSVNPTPHVIHYPLVHLVHRESKPVPCTWSIDQGLLVIL